MDINLALNKATTQAKSVLHPAASRGTADFGWLHSRQTFSFGDYHNPARMHFGALRVLNDDVVAPGQGFGLHPHADMEIVSIPLEGALEHRDSMGNRAVIRRGDVQVMSAGTGIRHSEYNQSKTDQVKFLQIWVFPRKRGVEPRYDQITLPTDRLHNVFTQIVSPNPDDAGVWVHADAWFSLGLLDAGFDGAYSIKKPGNGLYVFVLSGQVSVNGQALQPRDGYGLWDATETTITASANAEVLLMDVPMV